MKMLVVEDNHLLNKTLCYNLSISNYSVDSAENYFSAKNLINTEEYDLIILDVNLPDGSGFDLCRIIKEVYPDTAVIFLTANDQECDMIKGFELGADDYVTKPFPISVFQRKVTALVNRLNRDAVHDIYDDGNLLINFDEMYSTIGGEPIILTASEYRILRVFAMNPKIVLTRQVLLEKLWDTTENFVDEHALTAAISRIRSKIEEGGRHYIKTVYGMGYIWIGEKNDV